MHLGEVGHGGSYGVALLERPAGIGKTALLGAVVVPARRSGWGCCLRVVASSRRVLQLQQQIAPNAVYGANRPNGANDIIVDGSVAQGDIRPNSLKGDRVADAGLTGADLADGSVSGAKLTKNSVRAAKIANDSLTGTQINESSLGAVPTASSIDVPASSF